MLFCCSFYMYFSILYVLVISNKLMMMGRLRSCRKHDSSITWPISTSTVLCVNCIVLYFVLIVLANHLDLNLDDDR